jgi:hypothetical protein
MNSWVVEGIHGAVLFFGSAGERRSYTLVREQVAADLRIGEE